ncbi:CRE-GST-9 protein [Aphelenchoides bicaudatus]|nr:CRE-GST-9 protein [Aphelenchoides bicaudatus]
MPNYKLHYFNWRGGCEGLRLLFHYAKVPFVDEKYEMDSFDNHRDAFPYKQLPVLEVDDKRIAQSHTIMRYLSKEFNLDGKDKWETIKLDELMELQHDFHNGIYDYYGTIFGYGEGTREDLKQTKLIPALEKFLPHFEKALDRAGSGFYTKNGPSGFDFWMAELIEFMAKIDPDEFAKYPKLLAHVKKVHSLPELQEYLSSSERPPEFKLP